MTKLQDRPIGIFDSGLGGLTVVKEIIRLLPRENIIYLGDTARVPYGPRGVETIKKFSDEDTKFLISKHVKAIVIACNTSSAVASKYLKDKYKSVPIFEVIESASNDAMVKGKRIGVIGTYATIGSHAYTEKILKSKSGLKVFGQACPLFVPFIEEGEIKSPALKIIAKKYLSNLKKQKIDTLILGCTHYPIIENVISGEIGKNVKLINPGKSIAKEISTYFKNNDLLNTQKKNGDVEYFVTDLTDRFTKVAEMFLGERIKGRIKKASLNS
jgi:glutamate racemase